MWHRRRRPRLWLLKPRADVLAQPAHPWRPPYEKTFAVVVRAGDERAARAAALTVAGNEGLGIFRELGCPEDQVASEVWVDPGFTQCTMLEHAGEPGVIVYDRREG